jgi:serine/threonine-protein kinase
MGWWKGMLTHARILYPYRPREEDPQRAQRSWMFRLRGNLIFFGSLVGTVFVLLLARRNWKLGRTDRRGALRVAVAKFIFGMIVWLGTVHPVQSEGMVFALLDGAAQWVLASMMIWLVYLALEPAVRSHWPQSLVTWNRVLAGRWSDPQVGAHVLIGATIGCAVATVSAITQVWLQGDQLIPGGALGLTLGVRQWLADHAETLLGALNTSLVGFFCIFGLRMLLRKDILAALVAAVLFALSQRQVLFSADWELQAIISIGMIAILIFVLLRLGFVAVMSALFFIDSFDAIVLGLDWKAWYAPFGVATIFLLMAIALTAFYQSLGSRDLLGSGGEREQRI